MSFKGVKDDILIERYQLSPEMLHYSELHGTAHNRNGPYELQKYNDELGSYNGLPVHAINAEYDENR